MPNALGLFLRNRRGVTSLRDFSRQCGISHTHLDSIEKGADPRTGKPVSISTETLRLIANGLGESYITLACLAESLDPATDGVVLAESPFGTLLMPTAVIRGIKDGTYQVDPDALQQFIDTTGLPIDTLLGNKLTQSSILLKAAYDMKNAAPARWNELTEQQKGSVDGYIERLLEEPKNRERVVAKKMA